MREKLPEGGFERKDDIYNRVQRALTYMREFIAANPLEGDEKTAVVCHSQWIAGATADGYTGEGQSAVLTNQIWMQNAQACPYEL